MIRKQRNDNGVQDKSKGTFENGCNLKYINDVSCSTWFYPLSYRFPDFILSLYQVSLNDPVIFNFHYF